MKKHLLQRVFPDIWYYRVLVFLAAEAMVADIHRRLRTVEL